MDVNNNKGWWKDITHKELFDLSIDLTIDDWNLIRTDEYWERFDQLTYDSQKDFTLRCVKQYKKKH